MKYGIAIGILLTAGLAMAEIKPSTPPLPGSDTMHQSAACNMQQMDKGWGMGYRHGPMGDRFGERMGAFQNMKCCPAPFMMRHSGFHRLIGLKIIAGLLFLCVLFVASVNVLLTILVSLDMRKRGAFNGLWIPLLLIAGIPSAIIYSLFRMGDNLARK